jgi:hypothetical protein
MLTDEDAARIEANTATADRATLARWVADLLADRRWRTTLLQGQTRRVAYTRKRLKQAAAYLDGLLRQAQDEAGAAWPGQLPCPHCGAPALMVRAEQRDQGYAVVHDHGSVSSPQLIQDVADHPPALPPP